MKKLMIFAPHPDDDIIGCGGTIAKNTAEGNTVSVVYISSGEAGSLNDSPGELAVIREEEARRAAALLGVNDLFFLRRQDGYIAFEQEAIEKLIRLIRAEKPDTIYLPHAQESVRDHQISHQLVIEACNRAAGPWFQHCGPEPWSVSTILAYEVWTPLQTINQTEDISDFMDVKIAALREHRSQIAGIAYDEGIQGLNRYRGAMTGRGQYCECFQIIKA